jgi:hypothetical protein
MNRAGRMPAKGGDTIMITSKEQIEIALQLLDLSRAHDASKRRAAEITSSSIDNLIRHLAKPDQAAVLALARTLYLNAPLDQEQADDPEPHDQTFHGPLDEYEVAHDEWLQRRQKKAREYVKYASEWIDALDHTDTGMKRWQHEKPNRNRANVGADDREMLHERLERRLARGGGAEFDDFIPY